MNHRNTQSDALPAVPNPSQNPLRASARRKSGGFCQRKAKNRRVLLLSCNTSCAETSRKHPSAAAVLPGQAGNTAGGGSLSALCRILSSKRQRDRARRIAAVEIPSVGGEAKVCRRRRSQDHRALLASLLIIHEAANRCLQSTANTNGTKSRRGEIIGTIRTELRVHVRARTSVAGLINIDQRAWYSTGVKPPAPGRGIFPQLDSVIVRSWR